MLSETERDSLSDILFNIDLANSFAGTRCLEIISEASRRLSAETKARHPNIPWRQMSASGNIYRHDYEDVAHRLVWGTVHEFLPALRVMAKAELAEGG